MSSAEPVLRAPEIEEFTNLHIIHPLSRRMTQIFARHGFRPNTVSFMGMACGIMAGVSYHNYQSPGFAIAGFLFMIAWHVFDGADGQLARLLQAQSEFGKIIDGICDYTTFISVYVGLGTAIAGDHGNGVWLLIVAAGVVHAMQAAAYEVQRQEYNYWGLNRKSAELPWPEDFLAIDRTRTRIGRVLNRIYRAYVWMQYRVSGATIPFRRRLAGILDQYPEQEAAVRARYRDVFGPTVRHWAVLSSNYRTMLIFVCVLAGVPLAYFTIELVGLSLVMLGLSILQRRRYEMMSTYLNCLPT